MTECCWVQTLVLFTQLLTDTAERRQPEEKGKQSPPAKILQKVTNVLNTSFSLCTCKSECFIQLKEMAPATNVHPHSRTAIQVLKFTGWIKYLMELQECPGSAGTLQTGPKTHGRVTLYWTQHWCQLGVELDLTLQLCIPTAWCQLRALLPRYWVPSTPGLSKHSPNYFLPALSQFLQAQLDHIPVVPRQNPTSIPTFPFSPFCTLMICHMPQSLTLRQPGMKLRTLNSQQQDCVNSSLSSLRFKLSNVKYCKFGGKCWSVLKEMIAYKERFLC